MRAVLTVGLPGCGKSTWAGRWLDTCPGAAELNLDAFREAIAGDARDQSVTKLALAARNRLLNVCAREGRDVIVSDTHARRRHRKALIRMLRRLGYRVEVVFFDVGVETCKQRNANRGRVVPEAAIDMMARRLRAVPPLASDTDGFTVITEPGDPLLLPVTRKLDRLTGARILGPE